MIYRRFLLLGLFIPLFLFLSCSDSNDSPKDGNISGDGGTLIDQKIANIKKLKDPARRNKELKRPVPSRNEYGP